LVALLQAVKTERREQKQAPRTSAVALISVFVELTSFLEQLLEPRLVSLIAIGYPPGAGEVRHKKEFDILFKPSSLGAFTIAIKVLKSELFRRILPSHFLTPKTCTRANIASPGW